MTNQQTQNNYYQVVCPYCGGEGIFRDSAYVYENKYKGSALYVCELYPKCDSYVSCHNGSIRPRGTMANKELRHLRMTCHKRFDILWKCGAKKRHIAYWWLQAKMGLNQHEAHIGKFTKEQCLKLLEFLNPKSSKTYKKALLRLRNYPQKSGKTTG